MTGYLHECIYQGNGPPWLSGAGSRIGVFGYVSPVDDAGKCRAQIVNEIDVIYKVFYEYY